MILQGKNALVTGGSRGIGRAIVLELAKQGCNVAFTYAHSQKDAETVKEMIENTQRQALMYQADAKNTTTASQVVNDMIEKWQTCDILVNNAGISKDNLLIRMGEKDWDDVVANNLKSVYNYSKAVIPYMIRKRCGSIINISSIIGIRGNAAQTNYAATKAGIIAFSKSLAKEVGSRQIRVNVVAPGYVKTDMTQSLNETILSNILNTIPMKRAAEPNEIAQAVSFLSSDAASYITGVVLKIDGGMAI